MTPHTPGSESQSGRCSRYGTERTCVKWVSLGFLAITENCDITNMQKCLKLTQSLVKSTKVCWWKSENSVNLPPNSSPWHVLAKMHAEAVCEHITCITCKSVKFNHIFKANGMKNVWIHFIKDFMWPSRHIYHTVWTVFQWPNELMTMVLIIVT